MADGVQSENRLLLKFQIHRRMITWFPGPLAKWQLEEWNVLPVQVSQVKLFTVANQRSGEDIFYCRSQCEELLRNGLKQLKRCLVSCHCRLENSRLYQAWATANHRKTPAIHETHNQYNKLPKLTPMDLSRMKAEKDARDGQDLALARQRQSEQVRLMREQTQRVATIPVRNVLLSFGWMLIFFADCCVSATTATKHISVSTSNGAAGTTTAYTAATSAPTYSNPAIAPNTSPTTSYPESAINWRLFNDPKSICNCKIVYRCKCSAT